VSSAVVLLEETADPPSSINLRLAGLNSFYASDAEHKLACYDSGLAAQKLMRKLIVLNLSSQTFSN
jgi:hypothetical protein